MSHLDRTLHIPKFGGDVWYINKGDGDDTYDGKRPDRAFETIGAGISAMSAGDALSIKAGTYTETGLTLSDVAAEMWCEIGVLIDPASGTALTVSGASCRISGDLKITPDPGNAIGLLVSGAECNVEGVKVLSGTNNIQVTGAGVIMRRCSSGFASAGNACFDIQGEQGRYINCNCVGDTTSYGYKISNGVDTGVLENCTSAGNQTSGFYIDTLSQDWTLLNCSTGAGDGRWVDVDDANVWSNFSYPDEIHTTTTFSGATTAYNIFKVTGSIFIEEVYGTVETVIPNTSSDVYLQLYSTGGTDDITDAPGTDIDSAVVGALLLKQGYSGAAIQLANPNTTPVLLETTSYKDPLVGLVVVEDDTNATYIRLVISVALASGAIHWHCKWQPLSDDGFLEDA